MDTWDVKSTRIGETLGSYNKYNRFHMHAVACLGRNKMLQNVQNKDQQAQAK